MFRPHGPSSSDHKQTFSTYLQEDFFPQRIVSNIDFTIFYLLQQEDIPY
jgi:hypothetical protein